MTDHADLEPTYLSFINLDPLFMHIRNDRSITPTPAALLNYDLWAHEERKRKHDRSTHKHSIGCGWCEPPESLTPPTPASLWGRIPHTHIPSPLCWACAKPWVDDCHRDPVMPGTDDHHEFRRLKCVLCRKTPFPRNPIFAMLREHAVV